MSLDHAAVAALRRHFSGTLVTAHHPEVRAVATGVERDDRSPSARRRPLPHGRRRRRGRQLGPRAARCRLPSAAAAITWPARRRVTMGS